MKYRLLKLLLLTTILTIITTDCFCQFDDKIRKDSSLKGNIDSCVTIGTEISYKNGVEKRQLNLKLTDFYNTHGQIVKTIRNMVWNYPDTTITATFIITCRYNKDGSFEMMSYNAKGVYKKDIFKYTDGKSTGRLMHYDLQDNTLTTFIKVKLNSMDDIVEKEYYRDSIYSGEPYKKINYYYNSKGYLTKDSSSFSNTSRTDRHNFIYDKDDNLTQILHSTYPKPSIQSYAYPKFDKLHNWLERDTFSNGKLDYVFERRISYRK